MPVYGLGQFDDGRPFYAMRFIRGNSLKDAIERFHRELGSENQNSRRAGERQLPDSSSGKSATAHDVRGLTPSGSPNDRSDLEHSLEFRKLIQRLIDVCNAIGYAHSRGVLHRDLKPGNIMLGKYGETLVVDWGLAKAKGQSFDPAASIMESLDHEPKLAPSGSHDVAPTQMGSAIGTPQFMSPEQAAGRLDLLGPSSGIYSLGAILYQLLTGEAPFSGLKIADILRHMQAGDLPRPTNVALSLRDRTPGEPEGVSPRTISNSPNANESSSPGADAARLAIPLALEAICLKAMTREPSRRYATSQALAEDLERWLAGDPVSAWREPILVRAKRWVRRHQTLVTSAAAVLLVSIVSLTALSVIVTGKNSDLASANTRISRQSDQITEQNDSLEQANQTLTQTNAALEKANAAERRAKTEAEASAAIAREQSTLALQSLGFVIFDIQRGLKNVPGAGAVRRKLIQDAIDRLQKVSDQYASRSAIDRNTKVALDDLGDVFLRIGSESRMGTPARPSSATSSSPDDNHPEDGTGKSAHPTPEGPLAAARKCYQQAFDIAQNLAAADPTDAQAQRDLFVSFYNLGEAERAGKQFDKAMAWYEKAAAKVKARQEAGQLTPRDKNVPKMLEGRIQQCRHAATALGDWKMLLEQPPELLPVLLEMRGIESIKAGQIADAVQAVTKLRELKTATANQLYNAACVFSLSAAAIKPAEGQELTAEQSKQREQYLLDAVATLKQAVTAGYKDFAHLRQDTDLKPLHGRPDFEALFPKMIPACRDSA